LNRGERLRLVGALQQLGGTRLVTLEDGAERGVRAIEFRTTTGLEFAVLVDRGFDIGWCRFRGKSIAWHSPTGWVAPWYRETPGLGWLRSFAGGLLTTCGLDHIHHPEIDPNDTYDYPGRSATEYGLHGRIANVPALLRGYGERWEGDSCTLWASGEVRQAGALAENLVLRRTVTVDLDGFTIRWEDEVTNEGHHATPHMLLYHVNLGAPLLSPSCELEAPIARVRWASPTASTDSGEHLVFHGPKPGFVEQAFEHELTPDADGPCRVALMNKDDPSLPWGARLTYDPKQLPYFVQWRYFGEGTYVLGLEPSTNGAEGRLAAREKGELQLLESGESRNYATEIEIITPD
jgi:hypothetical protein